MKYFRNSIILFLACTLIGCSTINNRIPIDNFSVTSKLYDNMLKGDEPNVALLNLFLTKMPKGGDIHHHYTGTIYAETYLDWVSQKGWLIDPCSLKIVIPSKDAKGGLCEIKPLPVEEIISDTSLYRKLLTLWSDKDFKNHSHDQPPPDLNFFNTFEYFGVVSNEYMNIGLKLVKNRAVNENVAYIETMLSRVVVKGSDYISTKGIDAYNKKLRSANTQAKVNEILNEILAILTKNPNFKATVEDFVRRVKKNHKNIDDDDFIMRYQTYAVRVLNPVQVFIDLFSGYISSIKSPLIVGVNIVAPENNAIALSDYTLHMRMYNYLKSKYPDVNRALHAGELTLGMVRPKDLLFHIREAREIADAQRIGHGVDIPYETHSIELLEDLKKNSVIEINLTSNSFILGVEKNKHPYLIYSKYNVPMVIATDDSGVSRNNLTNEFVLLSTRYKPSYKKLKQYIYNSIQYSFLSKHQKAIVAKRLDNSFILFEKDMANLYNQLTIL
ncbi:MAG: adenosine deaminase [Desulfobacteraceae bacterium 4572_19]|nr:MAG: adenosine deaminase [Desulfobacteraceae bacterium 4572_19]